MYLKRTIVLILIYIIILNHFFSLLCPSSLGDKKIPKKEYCEKFLRELCWVEEGRQIVVGSFIECLIIKCYTEVNMRNEIYLQIIKQLTNNSKVESILRLWQFMCLCLCFFKPTNKLKLYFENHLQQSSKDSSNNPAAVSIYASWYLNIKNKLRFGNDANKEQKEKIDKHKFSQLSSLLALISRLILNQNNDLASSSQLQLSISENNLGCLLVKDGQIAEAKELFIRALSKKKRLLGTRHSLTVYTCFLIFVMICKKKQCKYDSNF